MTSAKKQYLDEATRLYVAAYEPARKSPSLDELARQAPALAAADTLMKRAEAILEWPVEDRIFARLAVIVTGVVTSLIVAFIVSSIGLGR